MATYEYDDFRLSFTRRADRSYTVTARAQDGREATSLFELPLSDEEMEQAIRRLGQSRGGDRDIGVEEVAEQKVTAEKLGSQLASALLRGDVAKLYDAALHHAAAGRGNRGVRMTLSLADRPELLDVPWEFLFVQPTFLASQRRTPVVRNLETGAPPQREVVEEQVRILGVVASPTDKGKLDVEAERRGVEDAVKVVCDQGMVRLDWLDPCTPRRLREALRDGSYHIVHFVGHSAFLDSGDGVIFLTKEDGTSAPVSDTQLAALLGDQTSLQLVVLNSCEGARTTLTDPFAGIATALVKLGVSAVIAMQFEISDKAAITFAEELYTSLIGRQFTIDAAMAEARKAVMTQVNEIEWATPVLFLRNGDGQLFEFHRPAAALPTLPPPAPHGEMPIVGLNPDPFSTAADTTTASRLRTQGATTAPHPTVPPPRGPAAKGRVGKRLGSKSWLVIAAVAAAILLVAGGVLVALFRGDDTPGVAGDDTVLDDRSDEPTDDPTDEDSGSLPDTGVLDAAPIGQPRPRPDLVTTAVREADGETHLYLLDANNELAGVATDNGNANDTEPVWDFVTARLAFQRTDPDNGDGSSIRYVVPGSGADDPGKLVQLLIPWEPGEHHRLPAWTANGDLIYSVTDGCEPGPGCAETLIRSTFLVDTDDLGYLDALTYDSDVWSSDVAWSDVHSIAASPVDDEQYVAADADGAYVGSADGLIALNGSQGTRRVVFSPDGTVLAGIVGDGPDGYGGELVVWFLDGTEAFRTPVGALFSDGQTLAASISPLGGDSFVVLIDDDPGIDPVPDIAVLTLSADRTEWVGADVVGPAVPFTLMGESVTSVGLA